MQIDIDTPYIDLDMPAAASVAVVGNSPETRDIAAAIDAADCVVRFNNAAGFGGRTGSRVTHLALVNRGGQMREWLQDAFFLDRPIVRQARAFILPFPMLTHDENGAEQVCWTSEAVARLCLSRKPVYVLPESLHRQARRLLAPRTSGRPNPSTGFLVTLAITLARTANARPIDAYAFDFAGWPGHPWAAERAWFAKTQSAGRLRMNPAPR